MPGLLKITDTLFWGMRMQTEIHVFTFKTLGMLFKTWYVSNLLENKAWGLL